MGAAPGDGPGLAALALLDVHDSMIGKNRLQGRRDGWNVLLEGIW